MADPAIAQDDPVAALMQKAPATAATPVGGQVETPQEDPSAALMTKPAQGTAENPLKAVLEYTRDNIQKSINVGTYGFRDNELGHAVAEGRLSLDEANQKIDQDTKRMWESNDVDAYEGQNALTWISGEAAKQLPFLAASTAHFGVGFGVGAGATAVAAATGVGAVVPAGAGSFMGMTLMGNFAADHVYGQDYLRRRNLGATDEDAKRWAGINAVGQGFAQAMQMRNLAGVTVNAAKVPLDLARPALEKALQGFVTKVSQYPGVQATFFGELGTSVRLLTDAIEGTKSKIPGMVPTVAEAVKEFADTFGQMMAAGSAAHLVGHALTLPAALKAAKELHLQRQQVKLDAINESNQQIRDALQGKVEKNELAKPQTKAEMQRAQELAAFQEQKERLAAQEKEITQLDDQIRKQKRQGDDVADLEAQRAALMEDTGKLNNIVKNVEDARYAAAHGKLGKLLRGAQPTKAEGARVERGSGELQKALALAKDFFDNPESVEEAATDQANDLRREVAQLVGDVSKKNSEELEHLIEQVELAYQMSRRSRLKQLADEAAERTANRESFLNGLNPDKTIETSSEPTAIDAIKKLHVPLIGKNLVNIMGNLTAHTKTFFRRSAERDTLVRHFDTGTILNDIAAAHRDNVKLLFGEIEKNTGLKAAEAQELLRKGATQKIRFFSKGKWREETINKMLDKVNQWNDPEAREALIKGNGWIAEDPKLDPTIDGVEKALNDVNPHYLKLGAAYNAAYKAIYPKLKAEFYAKTGLELLDNPDYSGPMSHSNKEMFAKDYDKMLENSARGGKSAVATPGTTKARTGDTSALSYQDIHAKFQQYSRLTENWRGWRVPMKQKFGPVLNSTEINNAIKNEFGNDVHRSWHDTMDDIVFGRADKTSAFDRFVGKYLLKNAIYSALAGKPLMYVKHVLSTANAARYIPLKSYIHAMVQYYLNPIKHAKEIEGTLVFQARHAENEMDTAAGLQTPEQMEPRWHTAMNNFFMAPTVKGIRSEAALIYSIKRHWINEGLTEAEALHRADIAVNESQVSARTDMKAAFARGGIGAKLVFAFKSQVTNQAMDVIISWDRWQATKSPADFVDACKASAAAAYTVAVFESFNAAYKFGFNQLFPSKDQERNQRESTFDMIMNPVLSMTGILGLPLIKDVSRNAAAHLVNEFSPDSPKIRTFEPEPAGLVTEFIKSGDGLYQDVHQMSQDPDWLARHFFKTLYDINQTLAPFVKTPAGPTLHQADQLQKSTEGR